MLVHDSFVFLHVPKTAGRFIRHALARELPACEAMPDHATHWGWSQIPPEAGDRPVLAFVRNPWDWYVSWYGFLMSRPPEWFANIRATNPFLTYLLTDTGQDEAGSCDPGTVCTSAINDFTTTVRRACGGWIDAEHADELRQASQALDLAEPLAEGHDFYTARLLTILGDGLCSDRLTLGRYESLVDDLMSFMRRAGVTLSAGAESRMRTERPVGVGKRGPYRSYYDPALRDVVGESCKALIERFGYTF